MTIFGSIAFYSPEEVCDSIDTKFPSSINEEMAGVLESMESDLYLNLSNRGGGGAGAWIEGTVNFYAYGTLKELYKIHPFSVEVYIEWDDVEGIISGKSHNRKLFDVDIQGYAGDINEAGEWLDEFVETIVFEAAYALALNNPTMQCDV